MVGKEAAITYLKILSWHLPARSKYTHEMIQISWCPGRDSKPGPPEYEAGLVTARLLLSVRLISREAPW
jgi:hypothetical protein